MWRTIANSYLSDDGQELVRVSLGFGKPVPAIARDIGVSKQTIMRVRDQRVPPNKGT